MPVEPFLARPVVVGRHHQGRLGPDVLGVAHQADGFVGGVGAGPRDDRRAAGGHLDAELHHPPVFLVAESGGFAGGADRDQPPHAAHDLPLHQDAEGRFVEGAILEWRHQGGDSASELGSGHARNKP